MTYLLAFLAVCIFAIELYGNVMNTQGVIAWIHFVVVGSLQFFLLGYLFVAAWKWAAARFRSRIHGGS